jgi:hypothetical protein
MSNKDILSLSDVSTPEEKSELFGASVRNSALPNDPYDKKTVFKAIVLKVAATGLNADQISGMVGTSEQGSPRTNSTSYNAYRVRIIDQDSPHSFLPIPCSIQDSAEPANHLLINMHTLVFQAVGKNVKSLAANDIINIRLTPANFSYDLNYGMVVGNKISQNASQFSKDSGIPCVSASKAFQFSNNITTIASLMNSSNIDMSNMYTETGIPNIKVSSGKLLTPAIVAYLTVLNETLISKKWSAPLNITSGFRTSDMQSDIMYGYPGGKGPNAAKLRALYPRSPTMIEKFITGMNKSQAAAREVVKAYADMGINFSKHQSGLGLDLQTKNLTTEQVKQLIDVVVQTGGTPLFEPLSCSGGLYPSKRGCYNEHLHVAVPARYATIDPAEVVAATAANPGESSTDDI